MRKDVLGVMAVAMLLIVGLIAPATAVAVGGPEPNACQKVEYEYERTTESTETSELRSAAPEGDGWEIISSEEVVVQEELTATYYEWKHTHSAKPRPNEWHPEGTSASGGGGSWSMTSQSEVRIIQEEVTETWHVYERTVETTESSGWVTSAPEGDGWELIDTRIVDIPGCDLFELDPSNPAAGQCPAEEGAIKLDTGDSYSGSITIDGVTVLVTVDGKNVTFDHGLTFCVKASNGNSGYRTGTTYDVDFVNRGGNYPDISNLVIYGLAPVEPATQTITFNKVWAGESIEDQDVEVTFNILIDGEGVALGEGEESFPFPLDVEWEYVNETLVGFPFDECSYTSGLSGEGNARVVTNTVNCDDDDTVTITLAKEWFNADGSKMDTSPGLPWTVELYTTSLDVDGEPVDNVEAVLGHDGDGSVAEGPVVTEPFDVSMGGVRYGVRENIAEGEYVVVDCDTVDTDTAYDEQGVPSTNRGDTFSEDTYHLVCNQEVPPTIITPTSPTPTPRTPTPETETTSIAFVKDWAGDDFEGSEDVIVTFDVDIDGTTVTLGDGVASEPFDATASWQFLRENVTGFPDDECSYELSGDTGTTIDDVTTYTLTNLVTCEEVEVLPGEPVEREPEVVTPAPEVVTPAPEAVTPAPAVEVRGEVLTRTTPTRIDSGTGGSLDNSGLLALLLMGGVALSGFGITSAATARRRR